ncbi:MarR family winged helix-turn-helix transcriptional regulator [Clostridium estertheticum]|uniref:MarR family transcriptional regulator n=1 Tax=Clostridium estertheticum TaxID=238834 RepID=A0AA47ER55_9CLOT|nr:MarR family transcriptional regulator [Clostridium estertheticum]MBU3157625.1 MarR family transcriptional regulator [Clostridium estertheticum]WAG63243.1 MarR family transcriptional regulator [Clostridium estertheticum]
MTEKSTTEIMIHNFEKVMNKYNAWEKKPRYYETKDLLYRSEVHTIDAIGKNNKINVTELAQYLGITKGAVSQMVDKLIKKNMVNKKLVSNNENEVSLELTENGTLVYLGHEEYHKELYNEIAKHLNYLSNENIEIFLDILNILDAFLETKDSK